MSSLIKSRWRFREHRIGVPTLLRSLGIEFREVKGQSFWEANSEHIASIREDLLTEARAKFNELHPDKGGDAVEFDAFVQSLNNAKRLFALHMPKGIPDKDDWFSEIKRRKIGQLGRRRIYTEEEIRTIAARLRDGASTYQIQRDFGTNRRTSAKIRAAIRGPIAGCACGRVSRHPHCCKVRFARSTKQHVLRRVWSAVAEWRRRKGLATKQRILHLVRNGPARGVRSLVIASSLKICRASVIRHLNEMSDIIERRRLPSNLVFYSPRKEWLSTPKRAA